MTVENPYGRPWDYGVKKFLRRTVNPTELSVSLPFLRNQVLRVANDGADDEFIEAMAWAATNAAEEATQRAIMPQTWQLVLDSFPASGVIRLPRPPLIEILSVEYYDADGAAGELTGSPAEYESVPSGQYQHTLIRPVADAVFPSTQTRPDAVTVTFQAGFESTTDPTLMQINTGIALMVGELYKLRSLSVQEYQNSPSQLQLGHFWQCVDPVLA